MEKEIVIQEVKQIQKTGDKGPYTITTIIDQEGVDYQTFSTSLGAWLMEKKYPEPCKITFETKEREYKGKKYFSRNLQGVQGYEPPAKKDWASSRVGWENTKQMARSMAIAYAKDLAVAKIIEKKDIFPTAKSLTTYILTGEAKVRKTPEKKEKPVEEIAESDSDLEVVEKKPKTAKEMVENMKEKGIIEEDVVEEREAF